MLGRSGMALPFTSAQLRLRPIAESDLPHLVELAGDNEVARWTAAIPHPFSKRTAVRIWNAPAPRTTSSSRSRRARPVSSSVAFVLISPKGSAISVTGSAGPIGGAALAVKH